MAATGLDFGRAEMVDLCSSYSLSAASPRGDSVRPVAISPIDEVERPTLSAMSLNVSPSVWRSRIRDAHVSMARTLRHSVITSQRHSVTGIRSNGRVTIGDRVKEWREKRKMTVEHLAQRVGLRPSTIYDLERGDSKSTKKLHVIAAVLRVNVHYLEAGKGSPEDMTAPDQPMQSGWPFKFDRARFDNLSAKDRGTIEATVLALVEQLEKSRSRSPPIKKKAV